MSRTHVNLNSHFILVLLDDIKTDIYIYTHPRFLGTISRTCRFRRRVIAFRERPGRLNFRKFGRLYLRRAVRPATNGRTTAGHQVMNSIIVSARVYCRVIIYAITDRLLAWKSLMSSRRAVNLLARARSSRKFTYSKILAPRRATRSPLIRVNLYVSVKGIINLGLISRALFN